MLISPSRLPFTILSYISDKGAPNVEPFLQRPDLFIKQEFGSDIKREVTLNYLSTSSPVMPSDDYIFPSELVYKLFIGV